MLWRSSEILGYTVQAADESAGVIQDFLFNDNDWVLRWAVLDMGKWLPGRTTLLPPTKLASPNRVDRSFQVDLTRGQIESGPSLDSDAPVSRRKEADFFRRYGMAPYWGPSYTAYPVAMPAGVQPTPNLGADTLEDRGDPNLRSMTEVTGYHVEASDGDMGHVEEFIVGEDDWILRYFVVDTVNWLPGKKVLVSPLWFSAVDWYEQKAVCKLTREQVKSSPEYDPGSNVSRSYEDRIFRHYGFEPYWYSASVSGA